MCSDHCQNHFINQIDKLDRKFIIISQLPLNILNFGASEQLFTNMNSPMGSSCHQMSSNRRVCKYYQRGYCKFGNRCRNIHQRKRSRPETQKMQPNETKTFSKQLNFREMEASAASCLSQSISNKDALKIEPVLDKTCGICFDIIMEKKDRRQQVFGILPNCNHCFCFTCIRRWRQSKDFDLDVAKGCPECRKLSEFVYPSKIWFELKKEKEDFIFKEKSRMQKIDCRYFRKGRGKCPFGNICLYLHALPNGKRLDVGPPKPRRRRTSNNIEIEVVHDMLSLVHRLNDDVGDFFDLDLNDPAIAMQLYEQNHIRRLIALEALTSMNQNSDDDRDEFDCTVFL